MSEVVGTGRDGLVVPGDLGDVLEHEAAALGNGEDSVVVAEAAPGNEAAGADAGHAGDDTDKDRDWGPIDRHADRVVELLGKIWEDSEKKAERTLGKLLLQTEAKIEGKFRAVKYLIDSAVCSEGREQVAAAWRGPAEALRLLGGVLTGLSEKAGHDTIENSELMSIFPVLKTAEELLQRASQHEEGKLPTIDEALGGTGTLGARVGVVAASVGEAVALAEKMLRGTETPSRKTVAVLIGGGIVELGSVFGAGGENSEFVQRVERLRQERAGPVEGAESNDVRAFRADFGKELSRLRNAMRWRERGIWAAGLAVCLLFGWAVGISGADFSFVGRLL